ncbi:MAG: hypothetical protein ACXWL2_00755 [Candidatus Chromulinivorax sp.]
MKITSLCILFCIATSMHLNAMNNQNFFTKKNYKNIPKIMSLQLGLAKLKKDLKDSSKSDEFNKTIEEYHRILDQLNCLKSEKN